MLSLSVACSPAPPADIPVVVLQMNQGPLPTHPVPDKTTGQIALATARTMLGVSYRYGGSDPSGFDCSGLVHYAFNSAGIKLPRTSREIFRNSQQVNPTTLQEGDLVFFVISSNKISHVGIYDGHNRFIHAPSSGKGVSYASLDEPYWRERFVAAGRFQ